jgi:hypothetical protein
MKKNTIRDEANEIRGGQTNMSEIERNIHDGTSLEPSTV